MHIRNLKQALNNVLVLTKSHRTIKFKSKAWLKPYTNIHHILVLENGNVLAIEMIKPSYLWINLSI